MPAELRIKEAFIPIEIEAKHDKKNAIKADALLKPSQLLAYDLKIKKDPCLILLVKEVFFLTKDKMLNSQKTKYYSFRLPFIILDKAFIKV